MRPLSSSCLDDCSLVRKSPVPPGGGPCASTDQAPQWWSPVVRWATSCIHLSALWLDFCDRRVQWKGASAQENQFRPASCSAAASTNKTPDAERPDAVHRAELRSSKPRSRSLVCLLALHHPLLSTLDETKELPPLRHNARSDDFVQRQRRPGRQRHPQRRRWRRRWRRRIRSDDRRQQRQHHRSHCPRRF
jgi:hypothetical protein